MLVTFFTILLQTTVRVSLLESEICMKNISIFNLTLHSAQMSADCLAMSTKIQDPSSKSSSFPRLKVPTALMQHHRSSGVTSLLSRTHGHHLKSFKKPRDFWITSRIRRPSLQPQYYINTHCQKSCLCGCASNSDLQLSLSRRLS